MIENHTHNGIDSPRIDTINLEDSRQIFTAAPTHDAPEGSVVFYSTGGVYRMYVRLSKGWRVVALT